MKRDPWSLVTDETGKFSMARVALWMTLLVALRVVHADTFGAGALSPLATSLLTTMLVALIAWAAGPRFASYLLPHIASLVSAVAAAAMRRASGAADPHSTAEPTRRPGWED
jgi:hypothetical protein